MPGGQSLFLFRAWMFGPCKQQEHFFDAAERPRRVLWQVHWTEPLATTSGLGQWFGPVVLKLPLRLHHRQSGS